MKHRVWLSFDLGIRGDFQGMYEFLDEHGAKECGDGTATFWYEYEGDLTTQMKRELERAVTLDKRSRVYLIFPKPDGKHTGRFLIGGRKAPPWTGYAAVEDQEEDAGE